MRATWLAVMLVGLMVVACAAPAARADVTLDESNSWAFSPPPDSFSPDAVLDLSGLNERVAGESGFVRLSEDGSGFVRGDGQPIRFWSANCETGRSDEEVDRMFSFMAKRGVNLVRLFNRLPVTTEGAAITDVSQRQLDDTWRAVAIAKKHGIYSLICPYWAHFNVPNSWGIGGEGGKYSTGLLFVSPQLQTAYKGWVRQLYEPKNPYTGIPLKDDPSVAILQMQNEDGLFFWNVENLGEPMKRLLGKLFGEWLVRKYKTLDAAMAAWDGFGQPDDDLRAGVLAMIGGQSATWQMTQDLSGPIAKRMADEMAFLARLQYDFYAGMEDFYRNDLGCKQLINASNWKGANRPRLDDLERYTYTACEVIALNRYNGGIHSGRNAGFRIDPGDFFTSESATRNPLQVPVNVRQPVGHPFLLTENAWVTPNLYQSEGPMLVAAYMGLTGVDSDCWLDMNSAGWDLDPRRVLWQGPGGLGWFKWGGCFPELVGMFPANALMHRMGYIEQGVPAVYEARSMDDIYQRKLPVIAEEESYDPNRDTQDLRGSSGVGAAVISRLAFLVGPVEVKFGGEPADTRVMDLTPYVDGKARVVRASTGQMELHYGVGLFMLKAPKAQGVCGFLKAAGGSFGLPDVTIESSNDYAAIEVVAMDDRPLKESGKVLVQVGTVNRLTGWKAEPATFDYNKKPTQGEKIVAVGQPPWRIANTEATITVANPGLSKATLLDVDGYARQQVPVQSAGGKLTVKLPADTMYLVLQ